MLIFNVNRYTQNAIHLSLLVIENDHVFLSTIKQHDKQILFIVFYYLVLIEPLEGPNDKYKPITAIQHLGKFYIITNGWIER